MKLRGAKLDDLPELVAHGQEFYKATRYYQDGLPYDPGAVEDLCRKLITEKNAGVIFVITDEDRVVGFILVALFPFIFSPSVIVAGELAYYVEPAYRNRSTARLLLETAEAYCKVRGARYLTMVSMETSNPRPVEKLYERMGFVRNETSYTKEL